MTTIIVVVVVALVFFVTVCVVTFMVWKREAEMRTDSIRAIENNLERLGDKLSVDVKPQSGATSSWREAPHEDVDPQISDSMDHVVAGRSQRTRGIDPFSWIRTDSMQQVGPTEELPEEGALQLEISRHEDETSKRDKTEQEPLQHAAETSDIAQTEDAIEIIAQTEDTGEVITETRDAGEVITEAAPKAEEPAEREDAIATDETDSDKSSMEIELPDIDLFAGLGTLDIGAENEDTTEHPNKFGKDVGRSGRKYTAAELDMLIKE